MRVLLTEDDAALASFLRKTLTTEGYAVDLASSGRACREHLNARSYDLMLLDLRLPDSNGADLLAHLRPTENAPSVIVLTGHTQVEQRIRCLDLGADDFLMKPFSVGELVARCRAAMRRRQSQFDAVVRFGSWTLHRVKRSICWHGIPLSLSPKEFALLELLILREGECCTRNELWAHVWTGSNTGQTNAIEVYVNYVRRKLAAVAGTSAASGLAAASPLQTVRGLGYRLVNPMQQPRSFLVLPSSEALAEAG